MLSEYPKPGPHREQRRAYLGWDNGITTLVDLSGRELYRNARVHKVAEWARGHHVKIIHPTTGAP